jgi:hypothetical protein
MTASLTPQLKKLLLEVDCYFERQGKETMKSGTVLSLKDDLLSMARLNLVTLLMQF